MDYDWDSEIDEYIDDDDYYCDDDDYYEGDWSLWDEEEDDG